MREEVQLEALAQDGLVDLADLALPGRTRVRYQDIDAAEAGDDGIIGRGHRSGVGDVAAERKRRAADGFRLGLRGGEIQIEQRHCRAGSGESLRGRGADRAAGAGHHRHLAFERQRLARAQFGELDRPVFAIEQIGVRDRREGAERLRVGDAVDGRLGDVGGDRRGLGAVAETEQPQARHQHDAGQEIVHRRARRARFVALVIGLVFGGERCGRRLRGLPERVELVRFGRGHDQRPWLDADDMIRRQQAAARIIRDVLAVHKIEDGVAGAERRDLPLVRAFTVNVALRADAAQNRRNLGDRRQPRRQLGSRGNRLAVGLQARLGQRHEFDHALVGVARRVTEGEDAVLVEDQPFDLGVLVERFGRQPRQAEARPVIGHEAEPPTEHLGAQRRGVGLVDQAEHRGGVGVVDVFRRHEGVQQHLDRRCRRRRVEPVSFLHAGEVGVAHRGERTQSLQRGKPHGGQPFGRYCGHVPAGAFDMHDRDRVAGEVARGGFQRGVAAAVQHQPGVAAEQLRRVDAQRQIGRNAGLAVTVDRVLGIALIPGGFHGRAVPVRRLTSACSDSSAALRRARSPRKLFLNFACAASSRRASIQSKNPTTATTAEIGSRARPKKPAAVRNVPRASRRVRLSSSASVSMRALHAAISSSKSRIRSRSSMSDKEPSSDLSASISVPAAACA